MSLASLAITAEGRLLEVLELSHPQWPAPLRYANDTIAWSVVHEGGGAAVPYAPWPYDGEAAGVDDSLGDERSLRVPDPDGTLLRYVLGTVGAVDGLGNPIPTTAVLREYDTASLGAPLRVVRLELHEPVGEGGVAVGFRVQTVDFDDREAVDLRFTTSNCPGLRR